MRQTINLGGEYQKVEADQNQFSGSETANRLVFTVGKYEVADIFDKNKYAQDPRKDFLNWSLIDTATFDLRGRRVELYVRRGGRVVSGQLDVARRCLRSRDRPDGADLESNFAQFQWIGEIERRYQLWNHPGKIAVTGFLSRGRFGRYKDAVQLAQLTGGSGRYCRRPSISKPAPALNVNVEQEITSDLGVFLRAGFADGDVETDAYTDVDRTVAAGLSLAGKQWGRPDDTFGLAGIIDSVSTSHLAFLNAGGLGLQIGDGQLPNSGLEKIIETYYAFPAFGWNVTFDYQFIVNPAYNRDRGPVSVLGARLHAEF